MMAWQPPPPLVSVIIPVYNGERFLAAALRSVLAQEYSPLEIIVVDDGSTDATRAIARRFGDDVRYVYQARRGPAAARNTGLRLAQGEVVAFLDVDDAWPAGKLRRQVGYLAAHPEVDIVQGLIVQQQWNTSAPGPDLVFEDVSEPYQFVNLGGAVYRRSVFETVGLFDETLAENEDTDWTMRAWEHGVPKVVQDQVALFYRRHDQNLTNTTLAPQLKMTRLFKRHLDRLRASGMNPAERERPLISAYLGIPPLKNQRASVRDENFTLISNDCWGSGPYQHLGLMFRTPFIATRMMAPCYLELLRSLTHYVAAPAEFITTSRYDFLNAGRQADLGYYPIALLDGAIELHFMHEPDETTAWAKWERRRAKMNFDNLYIKFSQDPECCTDAMLEEFDRLDYPYKVCFTYRDYPEFRSTILVPDYFVPGAPMYFVSRTYFDAIAWLDKAHGPDTQAYRRAVATPTAKLPV